ncbi:hypothetical protein LCGC14_0112400 [marine sediment metagenome]|uniref:Uncharacterized protein n=2 Tax=root TaxID=1 RepID=A0A7V1BDZ1_9RHOB|nr:hypothetical protein [Sulfitobacter litoralis]HDZ51491.1 hypothetical protein [Sulfitobacter litoralis]
MNHTTSLSGLAKSHAHHPPQRDSVTLRYDAGVDADGDPVVYAVLGMDDLCKLPTDLLSGLGVGSDRRDAGGDAVFFIGDEVSMKLYVDTDTYPAFKADLTDIVEDLDMTLLDAHGDLRMLMGDGDDIATPDMPAFVHAGFERINTAEALETLYRERHLEKGYAPRRGDDSSGPQLS